MRAAASKSPCRCKFSIDLLIYSAATDCVAVGVMAERRQRRQARTVNKADVSSLLLLLAVDLRTHKQAAARFARGRLSSVVAEFQRYMRCCRVSVSWAGARPNSSLAVGAFLANEFCWSIVP